MDASCSPESLYNLSGGAFESGVRSILAGKVKQQSSAGRLQPQRHQKLLYYPKELVGVDRLLQVRGV